jgi:hypothetical protein
VKNTLKNNHNYNYIFTKTIIIKYGEKIYQILVKIKNIKKIFTIIINNIKNIIRMILVINYNNN